jgi:hypothetical protein
MSKMLILQHCEVFSAILASRQLRFFGLPTRMQVSISSSASTDCFDVGGGHSNQPQA